MGFCKECGEPLNDGAKFCKECGTTVGHSNTSQKTTNEYQATPESTKTKVPMSKRTKKLLIAAGVAVVVLFGGYKIGEALTSKDRLIDKLETALVEKDDKAVSELLYSNDKKIKIDENSLKGFMKYFKKNPDQISELIQSLKYQSKAMDSATNPDSSPLEEFAGSLANEFVKNDIVNLEKTGKFLFYDNYQLKIQPVYLSISTNYKDTELFIDGKKVDKANRANFEGMYGPFLPGYYNVKATLKNDFIDLDSNEDISLVGSGKKKSIDMHLDGHDVSLDFGLDSDEDIDLTGTLFINGKKVGVDPFKVKSFGPVLTNGSMKVAVEVETPWGKIKTKEVPIKDEYVDLNLGENEGFQGLIMDQIMKFSDEYHSSITSGETSNLTTNTKDYLTKIKDTIEDRKLQGIYYKGKQISTSFDLNSFNVSKYEGKWRVTVSTLTKMNEDSYYYDSEPSLNEEEHDETYTLIYDEDAKTWLVNQVGSSYFDDENTKEIKVENPKEYVTQWTYSNDTNQPE